MCTIYTRNVCGIADGVSTYLIVLVKCYRKAPRIFNVHKLMIIN